MFQSYTLCHLVTVTGTHNNSILKIVICLNLLTNTIFSHFFFLRPSLFYLLVHSRCQGFLQFHLITLKCTPQSVGLIWTRDQPVTDTSTWQHKHCTRQTSMPLVGFKPAITANAWPQTYALDCVATGIGLIS
jgi:hypothetical protein